MKSRKKVVLTLSILLISSFSSMVLAEDEAQVDCTILTDWNYEYQQLDESGENNSSLVTSIIHSYVVAFNPPFVNGSNPHLVNISIEHKRDGITIPNSDMFSNIIVAGGVIDITLPEAPMFGDEIEINLETLEASCYRDIRVTNWNQPISDHEITTNRTWSNSMSGSDSSSSSNLFFEGRGWQQRIGQTLISNELGSGNFELDNFENLDIELDLDKVWLNQTYFAEELIGQEFEMQGHGMLYTIQDGLQISVNVTNALYNRTLLQETFTEHLIIDGNGMIELYENSDNETLSLNGQISTFYFESLDSDGVRDFQQINLEASATSYIQFGDGNIELELEEFRFTDLWVYGVQDEQLFKYVGNADFNFIVSEEQPFIYTNGTVDNLHFEERSGLIVVDTLRVDGTYSGDASGSFGILRYIEDKGSQMNSSGVNFEVNKIRNENWFNVSSIPTFPVNQEFNAEHNLTYEYTVPQSNWYQPIIRYQYIEDNGSTSDEYPEASPIQTEVERPKANSIDATPITKETGFSPEILFPGDQLVISNNIDFILSVLVEDSREAIVDGHSVRVIDWFGNYGDDSQAFGSIINEGLLAGLFFHVNRSVTLNLTDSQINFHETQTLDKIRSPSIITAAENTPPSLHEMHFREGVLYAEGGQAHLEITVDDFDNDINSVSIDMSGFGLGTIELSDKGISGDAVIHDNIWTSIIYADGLEFGNKTVDVEMRDAWEIVTVSTSIEILNPAPIMTSISFTPQVVKRGDTVDVSVSVIDGHGVESVSLELTSAGGASIPLSFSNFQWRGQFVISDEIAPGERLIPIRLTDIFDSSRLTTQYLDDNKLIDALLIIENEAPTIINYNISRDGEFSNYIQVPEDGDPIPQVLEVAVDDPDGISSVQVKMGRLAPIGQSNNWILMKDDGFGVDRVSGDGIYSLEVFARSSLPNGEIEIFVRGTDIYLSSTSLEDQSIIVSLQKVDLNSGSGNWISDNTSLLLVLGLVFVLILSISGVLLVFRNSELE